MTCSLIELVILKDTLFDMAFIGKLILFSIIFGMVLSAPAMSPMDNNIPLSLNHRGNCDFENHDVCNYKHDKTGEFNWESGTQSTPSDFTGPSADHTLGKHNGKQGTYLFIESSNPRLSGDQARLISEWLQPTPGGTTCLRYFYSMNGHTIGALRVYVKHLEMDEPELLWELKRDQGRGWNEAKIPLNVNHPFKLIFEGETSYSYLGDIAIDDIGIHGDNACYLWPSNARPTTTIEPPSLPLLPGPDSCGVRPVSGRILGGAASTRGSWPWHTMIIDVRNSSHKIAKCSGSLLFPDWIVTAAHCVDDFINKNNYQVRVGAYKRNSVEGTEQDIGIKNIYIHPKFNTLTKYNFDVAMIHIERPAVMDDMVSPICLPGILPEITPGSQCWITGWGQLWDSGPHPGVLMQAQLPIVSQKECSHMESYPGRITKHMVCAGLEYGGIDTCDGDSGGPLVCEENGKWYLRGITSWGDGCGQPNKYGVYARVRSVQGWINSVVAYADRHISAYQSQ